MSGAPQIIRLVVLLAGCALLLVAPLSVWVGGLSAAIPSFACVVATLLVCGALATAPLGRRAVAGMLAGLVLSGGIIALRSARGIEVGTYAGAPFVVQCETIEVLPILDGRLGFRCTSRDDFGETLMRVWDGSYVVMRPPTAGHEGRVFPNILSRGFTYRPVAGHRGSYTQVDAERAQEAIANAMASDWKRLRWRCVLPSGMTLVLDLANKRALFTRYADQDPKSPTQLVPLSEWEVEIAGTEVVPRDSGPGLSSSLIVKLADSRDVTPSTLSLVRERPRPGGRSVGTPSFARIQVGGHGDSQSNADSCEVAR